MEYVFIFFPFFPFLYSVFLLLRTRFLSHFVCLFVFLPPPPPWIFSSSFSSCTGMCVAAAEHVFWFIENVCAWCPTQCASVCVLLSVVLVSNASLICEPFCWMFIENVCAWCPTQCASVCVLLVLVLVRNDSLICDPFC